MEVPILSSTTAEAIASSISSSTGAVTPIPADAIDKTFKSTTIDLISSPLGSRILATSDEWFAAASNLLTPTPPVRKPGVFTFAGAWYDGWETRRHNPEEYDWVVIRLGTASGRVAGVEVDTAFFNGNHAPEIAVDACFFTGTTEEEEQKVVKGEGVQWTEILGRQECGPSQRQAWKLPEVTKEAYNYVRLKMYPDGGIARFRLYGHAVPVFPQDVDEVFDLAAAVNGGVAVRCSDEHFGVMANLLLPGRGVDMGDGWETKRTRGEHVDWTVVRLGARGEIVKVGVDTAHFRGNYPQKVQVFAADGESEPAHDDGRWVEVVPPQKSGPDVYVEYEDVLTNVKGKTYAWAKLVMIPDGGIKRFRVFGKRTAS